MPKLEGLRMDITLRSLCVCLAYVCTKSLPNCHKTQSDAQARRVTDGYHASPSTPMFSLCSHSVSSNCHKQKFDAQTRRVTDGYHASRPWPVVSSCLNEFTHKLSTTHNLMAKQSQTEWFDTARCFCFRCCNARSQRVFPMFHFQFPANPPRLSWKSEQCCIIMQKSIVEACISWNDAQRISHYHQTTHNGISHYLK